MLFAAIEGANSFPYEYRTFKRDARFFCAM